MGTVTNGTVSVTDNKATYTPGRNYNGSDSFTFTVSDGTLTSTSNVTMTVTPVNDAPVSADASATVLEDSVVTVTLSGTDVDGDNLTYTVGTVTNGTVSVTDNIAVYTPNLNFDGSDSFNYMVSDGTLTSTSTVTVSVTGVYDLPEISLTTSGSENLDEKDTSVPIIIKIDGVDAGDEKVELDLKLSGTASSSDYSMSPTSIVLDKGVVESSSILTVIDDTQNEEDETIVIEIDNVKNAQDSDVKITITILKNDMPLGENSERIISRVYPNPTEEYFVIEFNDTYEIDEINMIDPLGRVYAPSIKEINKQQLIINSSDLSSGTHILRLKTDKGTASFRIIVE